MRLRVALVVVIIAAGCASDPSSLSPSTPRTGATPVPALTPPPPPLPDPASDPPPRPTETPAAPRTNAKGKVLPDPPQAFFRPGTSTEPPTFLSEEARNGIRDLAEFADMRVLEVPKESPPGQLTPGGVFAHYVSEVVTLTWHNRGDAPYDLSFFVAPATVDNVRPVEDCDGRRSGGVAQVVEIDAGPACYVRHESDHSNFAFIFWIENNQFFSWRSEPKLLSAEEMVELAAGERVAIR